MTHRRSYLRGLGAVATSGVAAACLETTGYGPGDTQTEGRPIADRDLTFGVTDSHPKDEKFGWYASIRDYLARETGASVRLQYADTYESLVTDLGTGAVSVAELGGLSAALGSRARMVDIVQQRNGYSGWTYSSVIVTRTDSDVGDVTDLAGRTVAFADRFSTSGALLPLYLLYYAGLETGTYPMGDGGDADFDASFTSHSEAWERLQRDEVAAAGVGKFVTYDREAGQVEDGYEYLKQSEGLPQPPLVTSPDLTDGQQSTVVTALADAPASVYHGADGTAGTADDLWFEEIRPAGIGRYQIIIDAAESIGITEELLKRSG